MTNIDQFESAFRSAAKEPFSLEDLNVRRILYICDANGDGDTTVYAAAVKRFTATAELLRAAEWEHLSCHGVSDVDELMRRVKTDPPDLICTYRNLGMPATQYPFSLGVYVDVLTQVTHVPVLLLPRPELYTDGHEMLASIDAVMAITDHLTGDHHLVSFAARLAEPGGTLFISHVEDEAALARYLATIGRIPSIDTADAAITLREKLLDEPRDYIKSCRKHLEEAGVRVKVEEIVAFGKRLEDYRRHIEGHGIDLLVMNTKDQDQSAMHGLAYPLTVELRSTPMMLL
jgi:nucleotide-binding universal stress UspA family protein